MFQSKFLEEAVELLYVNAIRTKKIRPVGQPQVSIKKFVPFTDLEFTADVSIIGEINLADYKNIKMKKPETKVEAKDVNEVIESLKKQLAKASDVTAQQKTETESILILKVQIAKASQ